MLRWLIGILVFANLLTALFISGIFGTHPLPAASILDPTPLINQVQPDALKVHPLSLAQTADQAQAVVGPSAPAPAIAASELQ